jgi:preprotein translocase subunit SecG
MLLDVLLVLIIVICVAMVGVILLQKSEGGTLGMGGGGPGAFMTARGAGDLLTRTTQILAGLFFALCLGMTMLGGHNRSASITDKLKINSINPPVAPVQSPPAGLAAGAAPASGAAPAALAPPPAQTGQLGLFGEQEGQARGKPGAAPANPLANITVQSSAPPARH